MMEKKNNVISSFQLFVLCFQLIPALFVSVGLSVIFSLSKQDTWIVSIISAIIGVIPLLLLIYIINYEPKKNIFEKNQILFGTIIGNIINFMLFVYVFLMVIIVNISVVNFSITQYLINTPPVVISTVIVLVATYAVICGIETICRTVEAITFIAIPIIIFIAINLSFQFDFDFLRPILTEGIPPTLKHTFLFISYSHTPLFLLLIIKKDDIVDKERYKKFIMWGYFFGMFLSFLVVFLTLGVTYPKIAELYRYPGFYVLRKIGIGNAINNVENILSMHWLYNSFIFLMFGLYFVSVYVEKIFKIKKKKKLNIAIIILAISSIIISRNAFGNPAIMIVFFRDVLPYFVFGVLLGLILLISIFIFIKKQKKNKAA